MEEYRCYLQEKGLSARTVESYTWTADYFIRHYGTPSDATLQQYKTYLISVYSPQTVNQRVQAINRYVDFSGSDAKPLKMVKVQQRAFLDEIMDDDTYQDLKRGLLDAGYMRDYFAVWLMAATGLRISELLELTVADVRCGYADLVGKGSKVRRVYFPRPIQEQLLEWLWRENRVDGFLFLNYRGQRITARGLAQQIKTRAREFELNDRLIHPHAFRHLMARKFLEADGDIALLADLLGHSSIETTRIYLRRTATEQRSAVDAIVTW